MSLFYSAGLGGTAIPDSGLFRLEFEDDSDTSTAVDSWGSFDGSITGATYSSTSAVGNRSLQFDGDGDGVDIPDDAALRLSDAFSMSIWVRPTVDYGSEATRGRLFGKGDTNAVEQVLFVEASGPLTARVSVGGSRQTLTTTYPAADTWTHYVLTFDSSNGTTLYENGIEADSDATTGQHDTNQEPIQIGYDTVQTAGGNDYEFEGYLDDPRYYDKELSETEVSNLYSDDAI